MGIHTYFDVCIICENKNHAWEHNQQDMEGAHCYECGFRWYSEGAFEGYGPDYEEGLVTLDEINHMKWEEKGEFSNLTPEEYETMIETIIETEVDPYFKKPERLH